MFDLYMYLSASVYQGCTKSTWVKRVANKRGLRSPDLEDSKAMVLVL